MPATRKLTSNTKANQHPMKWTCRKCGFSHTGEYPAVKCPRCGTIGEEAFEGRQK